MFVEGHAYQWYNSLVQKAIFVKPILNNIEKQAWTVKGDIIVLKKRPHEWAV